MVQAAQVLATQAKKAGVNVNVIQQTSTDYFANSYLKVPFCQDYWQTGTYMFTAGQALATSAPFNFTMFNDPEYNSLYAQAVGTLDRASAPTSSIRWRTSTTTAAATSFPTSSR